MFSKVTQCLITHLSQGKIMNQQIATWYFRSHVYTFFKWHVSFHLPTHGYSEFLFILIEALTCYQLLPWEGWLGHCFIISHTNQLLFQSLHIQIGTEEIHNPSGFSGCLDGVSSSFVPPLLFIVCGSFVSKVYFFNMVLQFRGSHWI